jgi:hypothetical protein
MALSWTDVVEIGSALPEVEESTSYGTPALKVRGKLVCRMKEDGESLAVKVIDLEDKEALLQAEPDVLFTTPHYDGYAFVLVRLDAVERRLLAELIEDSWRCAAPKRLLAAHEADDAGSD